MNDPLRTHVGGHAAAFGAEPAPLPDQRSPRRRMLKKAIASYGDGSISTDVIVRDMSDSGVKIKIKETDFIPDRFQIFIELDGIRADCEVVWRKGMEIGARFVSAVQQVSAVRSQTVVESKLNKRSLLRKKPLV